MAIQLSNKTDEELKKEQSERGLILKGSVCDFEVLEEVTFGTKTYKTEDGKSKAGNDMIILVLRVFYSEDEHGKVLIDYLTDAMEFKLRHAGNSCGVEPRIENGKPIFYAKDFIGKAGRAKIGIQKSKDERYGDKNIILDYVPKAVEVDLDDSIPDFTK